MGGRGQPGKAQDAEDSTENDNGLDRRDGNKEREESGSADGDGTEGKKKSPRRLGGGFAAVLLGAVLLILGINSHIHQRNNAEALDRLQSNMTAMQERQSNQEQIAALQAAQTELQRQLEEAKDNLEGQDEIAQAQQEMSQALLYLYVIESEYELGLYEDCQEAVEQFEKSGRVEKLPAAAPNQAVASPAQRYQQLKENLQEMFPDTSGGDGENIGAEDGDSSSRDTSSTGSTGSTGTTNTTGPAGNSTNTTSPADNSTGTG